jgi:hypothetical protein
MRTLSILALALLAAATAAAQTTADAPSIKVGTTIFADYTNAKSVPAAFNVSRAYINLTGNLNSWIVFRVTPDVARESGTGSSLSGSQTFRLKYAFAQFNLDQWTAKGSWVRLGVQQTPLVDYQEGIYRYRFQGTIFAEREGYLTSSDAGFSGHYNFPSNYGDIHAGYYNGEGYSKSEANSEKAIQVRASLRPLPAGALKGLRTTLFYDADHSAPGAERRRLIEQVTFESARVNGGFDHISAYDRSVAGSGWSAWVNPRLTTGWELLFRHDDTRPDRATRQRRVRNIGGVAYWFPNLQKVTSAVLVDCDSLEQRNYNPARSRDTRYGLKLLVAF